MKFRISINAIIAVVVVLAVFIFTSAKKTINRTQNSGITSLGATTEVSIKKEIKVTARQYSFSPNPIKLKRNEPVRLRITTDDVPHGFSVPDLGIDLTVQPGKESIINLQPDKKGTFSVICSIACGLGHSDMRSSIVVE